MRQKKPILGMLTGLLLGLSGGLQAEVTLNQERVHTVLDNGLEIYIQPDRRAPVVVHQLWYKIGSNFEATGTTGIAHMLEHMMFKGTQQVGPGEFSKIVARLGGKENAFTSRDYTAYYQVVGKSHLEKMMQLEADRMNNLVLKESDFQTERDVVLEERRWRVEDRPSSRFYEQFMAMAFVTSPQHHPIIGWMQDIERYTLEDAKQWYQTWYAPNNAVLVVVGDVVPAKVIEWATRHYGDLKSETLPQLKSQLEISQQGQRRFTLEAAVNSPSLLMGFAVPSLASAETEAEVADVYALSLLASILDGDDSARLTQNLIREQQILASASASYDETNRLQTLFTLSARPVKAQTIEQAETALWREIERLQTSLVTQEELQRVLAQAEAQYVYYQDSIQSKATVLGSLVSVGLPADTLSQWVERLREVTPQQIQQVAKQYLQAKRSTVGYLLPNGEKPKKLGAAKAAFRSGMN